MPKPTLALLLLTLLVPVWEKSASAAWREKPVSVSEYSASGPVLVDPSPDSPTVDDMAAYLDEKHAWENLSDELGSRIRNHDPENDANKIIIMVHKSENPAVPEFMEVFRQRSRDAKDLEPLNLFEDRRSNQALVSTAGTYSGKKYVTPSGVFAIDSMEVMHYSSKYNNAPMPWTMFFNGGIAIHAATPSEFKALGRKASHGCVRVHPANAKLLFDFVKNEGRGNVVIHILDN